MKNLSLKKLSLITFGVCAAASVSACAPANNSSTSADTSASENSASAIAGAAASSDGGTVAFLKMGAPAPTFANTFERLLKEGLMAKAEAASCPTTLIGGGCSTNTMSLSLNGCNPVSNPLASWQGSLLFTYSSAGVCSAVNGGGLTSMGAGGYVTITSAGGVTRTATNGTYVNLDSNTSGWQTAYGGGLQVTCNSSDCLTGAGRTVSVLGQHRALYAASGTKLFDHTLYTTTPFTVTGAGSNRVVSAGALLLEHNLAHYLQTATITQPLTYSANCCFPTGGQIQTTFTGYYGHTATETTVFNSTCGSATMNGTPFTLTHCL